jgi:hypothetical protein
LFKSAGVEVIVAQVSQEDSLLRLHA